MADTAMQRVSPRPNSPRTPRRLGALISACAAAGLLAACAVPPGAQPAQGAAAAEFAATAHAVLLPAADATRITRIGPGLTIDRWWQHFGDADLNRLVEHGLAHNADLAIAAARLREARALLDETRSGQRPAVALQASHGRGRASAESLGLPAGSASRPQSQHRVALEADYEVDLWGRLASASDAARARLAAQGWARATIEWGLTAQLAEAHYGLRSIERQLEIADSVRAGRVQTLSLRRSEFGAGAGTEFEVQRADAEVAAAESTIAGLQRQRLALESTLSLLAGLAPGQIVSARSASVPLDPAAALELRLPQGPVSVLLAQRPDVRRAEADLAATQSDIHAARAATWPALRLSGSVGSDVRELSNLFTGPGFAWSLAAGIAQSVYDGGRNAARVEQAEARADAALAGYRKSVATALAELREAYAAFATAERALHAERQRVAALSQASRLARLGREAGALTQLDALDAERNHFQAQLAEVDAYRDRIVGQIAAYKALGGGHGGIAVASADSPAATPTAKHTQGAQR
jgi:multidrug efflux system outer membrane protein